MSSRIEAALTSLSAIQKTLHTAGAYNLEQKVKDVIEALAAPGADAAAADEMSPDFTDTARAALLSVLWHHQGGSSPVGQPIRFTLGMGQHERLTEHQIREAKRWEALSPETRHAAPAAQPVATAQLTTDEAIVQIQEAFEAAEKEDDAVRALTEEGVVPAGSSLLIQEINYATEHGWPLESRKWHPSQPPSPRRRQSRFLWKLLRGGSWYRPSRQTT
jgi:hypothetical protein